MASKSITGLTADMYATVTFSDAQVSSGQYAPFCQTLAGEVRLYAKSDVGTQTIPTISVGMDDSSAQQSMSNFVTLTGAQTIDGAKTMSSTSNVIKASNPASGSTDNSVATTNWISQTGDSSPNNLVHRTGNETISSFKQFNYPGIFIDGGWHNTKASDGEIGDIKLFAKFTGSNQGKYMDFEITQFSNTAICYGILCVHLWTSTNYVPFWAIRRTYGANNPLSANSIVAVKDTNGDFYLGSRRVAQYGNLGIRVMKEVYYGNIMQYDQLDIEWLSTPINIGDGTGYTLYEAIE